MHHDQQSPLHDFKGGEDSGILRHGVVDKQPGQIKQPGEPGDDEDDMERLQPQHVQSLNETR